MAWEPLSVREGRRKPGGPYEGVPAHLKVPLQHWLDQAFQYRHAGSLNNEVMLAVAAALRVPLISGSQDRQLYHELRSYYEDDGEKFLDVIHATLQVVDTSPDVVDRHLALGGSVWASTKKGLERRVDATARAAFDAASSPRDVASNELREAWLKAYARNPDASDAWDHAIKAVEAVLIPIVVPKQARPHLGHVIGRLDAEGDHRWSLLLGSEQGITPIQTLVGMLRLLWPNPDRHTGPDHREPLIQEAQAAVQLAVLIVQWARAAVLWEP